MTAKMEQLYREILEHYRALESKLADSELLKDREAYEKVLEQYGEWKEAAQWAERYFTLKKEMEEIQGMVETEQDPEMRAYLQAEIEKTQRTLQDLHHRLQKALLPSDPAQMRNAIVEIRAGTGGEEAALFAGDLLRMYIRYAERRGWKATLTEYHPSDLGGVKRAVVLVEGKGAYGALRYESGVHRVQRIPVTESGGRIHTSTASVVVLPEAEEVELEIRPDDLRIETFRASGPGGQHMQKNETAVRITHIPTGMVVVCQDERSQHQNRIKALRILRSRLLEQEKERRQAKERDLRKSMIGSGDRSEKIRTYNFPQNRVTDHRIHLTLYQLETILDGDLDELIQALVEEDERQRLKRLEAVGSEVIRNRLGSGG